MVCLSLLSYQELSRLEQADHMAWSLGQEEALLKKVENQGSTRPWLLLICGAVLPSFIVANAFYQHQAAPAVAFF
jgi:hypothetical protein